MQTAKATEEIANHILGKNVAGAAEGTGRVAGVLSEVADAATDTRSPAQVALEASEAVESAVANLPLEVEDFLAKVAV